MLAVQVSQYNQCQQQVVSIRTYSMDGRNTIPRGTGATTAADSLSIHKHITSELFARLSLQAPIHLNSVHCSLAIALGPRCSMPIQPLNTAQACTFVARAFSRPKSWLPFGIPGSSGRIDGVTRKRMPRAWLSSNEISKVVWWAYMIWQTERWVSTFKVLKIRKADWLEFSLSLLVLSWKAQESSCQTYRP